MVVLSGLEIPRVALVAVGTEILPLPSTTKPPAVGTITPPSVVAVATFNENTAPVNVKPAPAVYVPSELN